ncbi:hypothetical protein DFJ73DRAFT_890830 [Zopfochytrium polystomum]|nr:hypothetical protein DFJ73DRAFT_890830 [Zopfochytrium polystomum]
MRAIATPTFLDRDDKKMLLVSQLATSPATINPRAGRWETLGPCEDGQLERPAQRIFLEFFLDMSHERTKDNGNNPDPEQELQQQLHLLVTQLQATLIGLQKKVADHGAEQKVLSCLFTISHHRHGSKHSRLFCVYFFTSPFQWLDGDENSGAQQAHLTLLQSEFFRVVRSQVLQLKMEIQGTDNDRNSKVAVTYGKGPLVHAHAQLLGANTNSSLPEISVLTELQESWSFYWIARESNSVCFKHILFTRSQALGFLKWHMDQLDVMNDICGHHPSN